MPTAGMSLSEIHNAERRKWDSKAPAAVSPKHMAAEGDSFERFMARGSLTPGVAEFLGDVRGKDVLEYGCGLGQVSVLLARAGANVTSFDLSPKSVAYMLRRVNAHGYDGRVRGVCTPAEALPFPDESFDIVFGKAILHHIDTDAGAPELARVIKPGGKAAFSEPLGMNPVLNLVREHVWYPKKNTRGEDHPLKAYDLETWGSGFDHVEIRWIQLLSMLERGLGFGTRLPRLRRIDEIVAERWPRLGPYHRYAVLMLIKGGGSSEPARSKGH